MPLFSGTRRRIGGLVTGTAFAAAGCAAYAAGWLTSIDNAGLDEHFRRLSNLPADPRIVLIDIDDSSIRWAGEWPWPRKRHAQLVRSLHELGASQVVLDVLFAEPSQDSQSGSGLLTGEEEGTDPNDAELRAAIQAAGDVRLAVSARMSPPRSEVDTSKERILALHRKAIDFLYENKDGDFDEFFRPNDILGSGSSREKFLWFQSFRYARAYWAVMRGQPKLPPEVKPHLVEAYELTPPLELLGSAAAGFGLVSFERESSGGVVRDLPLLVQIDGRGVPQLGFAAAAAASQLDWQSMSARPRRLQVGSGPSRMEIPTDRSGATLIHWHVPRSGDWKDSFVHVPASRLLELADAESRIQENGRRYAVALAELVEYRFAETPSEYEAYARLINEGLAIRSGPQHPADGATGDPAARLEQIDATARAIESDSHEWLKYMWQTYRDAEPSDDTERSRRERIAELYDRFGQDQLKRQIAEANASLAGRVARIRAELEARIDGTICLIGYTATAVGDLVSTPVHSAMPGVMVHANVLNTLLQRRIPHRAEAGANLALIGGAALLLTLLCNAGGWRFGLAGFLFLGGLVVAFGAWTFAARDLYFATAPGLVILAMVWSSITVYRQSTEERARRRLQRALTQYTSPAIAARIADQFRMRDLAPQSAVVTCFFCDLADFTGLSERLGPRRTRLVLNPYLEAMTRVLVERGAIVNKFIGDGVFAFFNAPIRPCANHAEAACLAAMAALKEIEELNCRFVETDGKPAEQAGTDGALALAAPLRLRIGVTTGEAFVGDYGSESKLDYTCIGDTVNTASRLENANKSLGTMVLVDGVTKQSAGGGFCFRSMGRLALAGKTEPVAAYELAGDVERVDGPTRDYIERFQAAMSHFQHCQWTDCLGALAQCRVLRPDDPAVELYAAAASMTDSSPAVRGPGNALVVRER